MAGQGTRLTLSLVVCLSSSPPRLVSALDAFWPDNPEGARFLIELARTRQSFWHESITASVA
jgi:hypothetical protein